MADTVLVEFGIELTCVVKGDSRRRRKVIAKWEDAPPVVWNEILRQVIAAGLAIPATDTPTGAGNADHFRKLGSIIDALNDDTPETKA